MSPQQGSDGASGELRLAPESIEALALRLAEVLEAPPDRPAEDRERLSAAEVAKSWGIGRRWVYEHADELGAKRLGSGPRPRLRFDPEEVAQRLGQAGDGRRSGPRSGDPGIDSLSPQHRATVVGQTKYGRGGA